jgi:23S rRNA (uracil1939-C5)-methyltransferase
MSLTLGQEIELVAEKAASGGRMIARHDGEVVLLLGAIPGERVLARITRAEKRVAFADTIRVLEPSPDRREAADPACGGCLYAFIGYERQLTLKREIVKDAFTRIGKIPIDGEIEVAASPEAGYRMRARFHVRDGRPGFYREGTHDLCDARATAQLTAKAVEAVEATVAAMRAQGYEVLSLELSENLAGDQRAVHLDLRDPNPSTDALDRAVAAGGLTGCTARALDTTSYTAGDPIVSDPLASLTGGRAADGQLRRHPEAFFQANRFLVGQLVPRVLDAVPEGTVLDLYAGVGLFAISLAASGRTGIIAVEGDPVSGRDLQRNAAPYYDGVRVSRTSVEAYLAARSGRVDTIIVDPPRTGMSKEAAEAIARAGASRVVYVSCDAPTMARDARRLLDAGYRLESLSAFDLFPNTPHVETLGVFGR